MERRCKKFFPDRWTANGVSRSESGVMKNEPHYEPTKSTPRNISSNSTKGTPKVRKKPDPEIYNRKNVDLRRVRKEVIKKQAIKPVQVFPPLGGKGRKSQFPEPLRLEQQRLQREHAASKGKREYRKRWDPNADPSRQQPGRFIKGKEDENISPYLTEAERFKEMSDLAAKNKFLHRKQRSPNKPPRQRTVSEANLLEDSFENEFGYSGISSMSLNS